jgi:hypothetical protein
MTPDFQNHRVSVLARESYTLESIRELKRFLYAHDVFHLQRLENGLYPAAATVSSTSYTGYSAVWIRDNVFVMYSCYLHNEFDACNKTLRTLFTYFGRHKFKFDKIIGFPHICHNVMQRPHVRFNGQTLDEFQQDWQHAQNDALGYFLWFSSKLIKEGVYSAEIHELELLSTFVEYFGAICFWKDPDSGHWEEERKVSASSIGVVVASLKAFLGVLGKYKEQRMYDNIASRLVPDDLVLHLIRKGEKMLVDILPNECIEVGKARRVDAALLFLMYPLGQITGSQANLVLNNIKHLLQGSIGISRYISDTFWCKNYDTMPEEIRTTISSERSEWFTGNGMLLSEGEEAQWCIFDSIISVIHATRFELTLDRIDLEMQTLYFNRSLAQLTSDTFVLGGMKCPELYYLHRSEYIPNDATPLLWSQANLRIAVRYMEKSLILITQ